MLTLFDTFQALVHWLVVLVIILPIGFLTASKIDAQNKYSDPKYPLFGNQLLDVALLLSNSGEGVNSLCWT